MQLSHNYQRESYQEMKSVVGCVNPFTLGIVMFIDQKFLKRNNKTVNQQKRTTIRQRWKWVSHIHHYTSSVGINFTWTLILCPGIRTPVGGNTSKMRGFFFACLIFLLRCIGICFSIWIYWIILLMNKYKKYSL